MKRQIILTVVLSVLVPLAVLSACSEERKKEDVSCKQAWELIQKHKTDTNFVIIDFRPKKKFDKAHLKNALYYDVYDDGIDKWLEALDKNKIYLIYCTMGSRSTAGLNKMKKSAFKNVFHMYQGIEQWQEEGYKTFAAPLKKQK